MSIEREECEALDNGKQFKGRCYVPAIPGPPLHVPPTPTLSVPSGSGGMSKAPTAGP